MSVHKNDVNSSPIWSNCVCLWLSRSSNGVLIIHISLWISIWIDISEFKIYTIQTHYVSKACLYVINQKVTFFHGHKCNNMLLNQCLCRSVTSRTDLNVRMITLVMESLTEKRMIRFDWHFKCWIIANPTHFVLVVICHTGMASNNSLIKAIYILQQYVKRCCGTSRIRIRRNNHASMSKEPFQLRIFTAVEVRWKPNCFVLFKISRWCFRRLPIFGLATVA